MEEIIANVDWAAVVVGAVVAFGVGWLWYGPLFGKQWMAGVGMSADDKGPMMHAMLAQAVGTFLLAWVIGLTASMDALLTAILIALTIATLIKANGLFARKGHSAIMVESSFILVMVAIMIAVHAVM